MPEQVVDTDFPWEPLPLRRVPEGQRDHEQAGWLDDEQREGAPPRLGRPFTQ